MVDGARLVPGKDDNPDYLYNLSKKLLVVNPAVQFTEAAKAGKFNDVTDPEYYVLLARIKYIAKLFFNTTQYDQNIFMLASLMMEHILKTDTNYKDMIKDSKKS